MAALMRHALFKTPRRIGAPAHLLAETYATKPRKPNPDKKPTPRIDSTAKSLATKGFLRAQAAYTPPPDLAERFTGLCRAAAGAERAELSDTARKFALLDACSREFGRAVPNSQLHAMRSTEDVLQFYRTPVETNTPLEALRHMELPPNLHVQQEYHRFHPETDTMFGGVTAFPRSSTLVTGLTAKKKYRGFEANTTWPYNT